MPHQPNRPQPLDEHEADRTILDLLLNEPGAGPWASDELARQIGDRNLVEDALTRLHAAGLIHRFSVFAFPARTTLRTIQLTA
jgi:predicted transcriptional regulator